MSDMGARDFIELARWVDSCVEASRTAELSDGTIVYCDMIDQDVLINDLDALKACSFVAGEMIETASYDEHGDRYALFNHRGTTFKTRIDRQEFMSLMEDEDE